MKEEKAECRSCRRELDGQPYHKGGSAFVPSSASGPRVRALGHHFGGYVCSASCNRRVFAEMMQSPLIGSSDYPRIMRDGDEYFENQKRR